jgi:hypothetical protein
MAAASKSPKSPASPKIRYAVYSLDTQGERGKVLRYFPTGDPQGNNDILDQAIEYADQYRTESGTQACVITERVVGVMVVDRTEEPVYLTTLAETVGDTTGDTTGGIPQGIPQRI